MGRDSEGWARAEFELGVSLLEQTSGDLAAARERALTALTNARTLYTYEKYPERWATIAMDLGGIFRARGNGDKSENLETAIHFYTEALKVYQRETHPLDWAWCQSEIGETIQFLSDGMDSALKERALQHFGMALSVITKENWPEVWHGIHLHLSIMYKKYALSSTSATEDQELSEEHYRLAFDLDRDQYRELYNTMLNIHALGLKVFTLSNRLKTVRAQEEQAKKGAAKVEE